MRIFTWIVALLLLIPGLNLKAQETDFQIQLKEFHTSDITDMVVMPGGDFFIASDQSGKIIMYRTNDYSYYKLIAAGKDNIPIKNLQLIHNNNSLLVSKGYDFYINDSTKADSIVIYNLENASVLYKFPFSSKIHQSSNDSVLVYSVYDWSNGMGSLYGTDKRRFPSDDLFRININARLADASYSPGGIVFYAEDHLSKKLIKLYDAKNQVVLYEEELNNVEIIYSFYDKSDAGFYVFISNRENNRIDINFIDNKTLNNVKVFEFESFTFYPKIFTTNSIKEKKIIISPNNDFNKENIILTKSEGGFQKQLISTPDGSSMGAYIAETNEILIWDKFNTSFENIASFNVYDAKSLTNTGKYPTYSNFTFKAFYIPGNNWLVSGRDITEKFDMQYFGSHMKFFKAGTFDNRFGMLNFEDYLAINHKIQIGNTIDILLNRNTGIAAFTGGEIKKGQLSSGYEGFYSYNFETDKVEIISNQDAGFIIPISYNYQKKRLLLSNDRYHESTSGSQRFKIVEKNKVLDLEGDFKKGVLSGNGSLVLTINSENSLSVMNLDNGKSLWDTILPNGHYQILPVDENNFFININKFSVLAGECRNIVLTLEYLEGAFKTEIMNCFHFDDIAGSEGKVAFIIQDFGLVFNDKLHPVKGSDRPVSLSLNDDGSRMMVNFQSGKINIYSTSDFSILGSMFHPNRKSHAFVDKDNHYFSNINAEEFFYAEENGSSIPLSKVEEKYFRPDEILSLLGKPDTDYLKTIDRAMAIRKNIVSPELVFNMDDTTQIKQILIDGNQSKNYITDKENITVQLNYRIFSESQMSVTLNNVHIRDINLLKIDTTASFSLPLIENLNTLKFTLSDKNGKILSSVEKSVLCQAAFPKPDLYLLSIGVSKYKQEGYDLTFADKDALEMANIYGDLNEDEIDNYRDKFFGRRIQLFKNGGENFEGEIREYEGSYTSVLELFPVDYDGENWLEIKGSKACIWNFKTNSIDSLTLPSSYQYDTYSLEDPVIPAPGNNGFYLNPPEEVLYHYSFINKQFTQTELPFSKEDMANFTVSPLSDKRWLKGEVHNLWKDTNSVDSIYITIAKPVLGSWKYDNSYFLLNNSNGAAIRGISADGKNLILSDYDNKYWYVKNVNKSFTTESINPEVVAGYDDRFYFNEDNTAFSILQYDYDEAIYNFKKFNLRGEDKESLTLENDDFTISGISNYNGDLKWLRTTESLANQPNIYSNDEKWTTYNPASFNRVFTRVLTNEEATSESIHKELKYFFQNAGIRDQIIVFVAGHGVLDDSLNYYYAPYDMDFNKVSEKGISLTAILRSLGKSSSTQKLLLMDACHSGNVLDFTSDVNLVSHSPGNGKRGATVVTSEKKNPVKVSDVVNTMFDNFMSASGVTILSASSGTDVAYENRELSNGAFTSAYMEILKNEISGNLGLLLEEESLKIPVELKPEIIYDIQKRVIEITNGKQLPDVREINEKANLKLW